MRCNHTTRRIVLAALLLTPLLALGTTAGSAGASSVQYCAQIPIIGGIPPWDFTPAPRSLAPPAATPAGTVT